MSRSLKKVLIIAYHFPPGREVGGTRSAKFAKFLPEYGWSPFVLTIRDTHREQVDASRLADVSHVPTYRTLVLPTVLELALRLKRGHRRVLPTRRVAKSASRTSCTAPLEHSPGPMRRGLPTLKRYLNSTFELPDRHVGWLPPAVWTGYRIIRQQGIDAIYATAPPATAAVAGHILSLLSRIPLVIDLRDGWNLHSTKPSECRSRLSDSCEERLERAITRRAHAIISTTPHYRGYLKARYPELPEEKFPTILNGFDPADFNGATGPSNASGIFTMSYLGTFYHGRTPREFLQALGGLVREGRLDPTGIRVNLIGDVHHAESAPVKEMIRSNGLDGCVTLLDPLPYREALSQMKRSDLLLLFAPEQYWYYAIPAKTFEYIAAHRPILCFGHRGATADLIRSTGTGIVVDAYNVPEIACAIDRLHARWKVCGELRHHCDTRQFERRELTRQLAAVLDSLPLQGPALNSHHVARLGNSS